ncbi:MAG: hypothetical protein Q4F95_02295 [Oscillospiraceae bacterium]|nr:hypothetical protein [Oscillospiraceae bacterium]
MNVCYAIFMADVATQLDLYFMIVRGVEKLDATDQGTIRSVLQRALASYPKINDDNESDILDDIELSLMEVEPKVAKLFIIGRYLREHDDKK